MLAGVGIASLTRAPSPAHRLFAAAPLLFATQQAAEGIVWLTFDGEATRTLHRLAVAIFLGFALVVWPMWLPFALRQIERDVSRHRALTALSWVGGAVSAYAAICLILWRPIAVIAGHSIRYDYSTAGDALSHVGYLLAYMLPTIVPFFVSTAYLARTVGVALIGSLAVTVIVQRDALTSVWCFFAAILSGLILLSVVRAPRTLASPQTPLVASPPAG